MRSGDLLLLVVVIVALAGTMAHAVIASYSFERRIGSLVEHLGDTAHTAAPQRGAVRKVVIPRNLVEVTVPRNGAYNAGSEATDDFGSVFRRAYGYATGAYPQAFGWYLPLPFLLPFFVHLAVVWVAPSAIRITRFRGQDCAYRSSFGMRALKASLYGFLIVVFFQAARMFWGSEQWQGAYFVSTAYGWTAFWIFFGLCGLLYLYAVVRTSGLQCRTRPDGVRTSCVRCGYAVDDQSKCPECGQSRTEFAERGLKVNHGFLAGGMLVAFFSPVLVAAMHSLV